MSSNLDNEDGEDDYMSDAFLKQCEDKYVKAVNFTLNYIQNNFVVFFVLLFLNSRTSLLFSHKEQYKHKLYKKRAECEKKSKKELTQIEIEKRNEALEKPICSANKGFILLEKMMGKDKTLDKNDNKNDLSALMNERKPIQIDFKKDRKGFGHEAPSLKRKENPNQEAISENDFIQNKRSKSDLFYTKKDFFNCQRSCVTLDQSNNRNQPLQDFFWPPEHRSKNDETQEDEDEEEDKDDEEEDAQ